MLHISTPYDHFKLGPINEKQLFTLQGTLQELYLERGEDKILLGPRLWDIDR